MCGIAGAVRLDGVQPVDRTVVERMLDAIAHRGPDGRGVVVSGRAVLGAVRLAVLDTSARGDQPMCTADGRHHLVHNGELYDVVAQRRRLDHRLRSGSDTEVLLHLLARDGEATFSAIDGMFASAWWDASADRLVIARDRFGEKPLFWARHDDCLWFASEEKALFAAGVPAALDPETWPELLMFRVVAGERTPYLGVRRLLPGHLLEVHAGSVTTRAWHQSQPSDVGALDELLSASVALRLQADVPVGLLLSGGIDSSSVAALATEHAGPGLDAFTMTYPGHPTDEADHARAFAKTLGLRHHEVAVDARELPALLEEATWLRGEPMALSAGAHLLALARHAREHVTVVLSGEGADELLGGYDRYRPLRHPRLSAAAGHVLRPVARSAGARNLARLARLPADRRIALLDAMEVDGIDQAEVQLGYRDLIASAAAPGHPLRRVLDHEQRTYLTSVLANADRATMGTGLECRMPFLDRHVADRAAAALPRELITRGTSKVMLRSAMANRLPAEVAARSKRPWVAPWISYLREVPALRELVRALPTSEVLDTAPLSRPAVQRAVDDFLDGRPRTGSLIWALARISLWHDVCIKQQRGVLA
jgi:asparagine synthase (glutamine-hydrolysing)